MRIAQITLNGYFNYGNILQKFALHHTLKKFADFTEVLWLSSAGLFPEKGRKPTVQCVKYTERPGWEQKFFLREAVRSSKFKDFENLHIKTRFNLPYFEEIADEYDFFVVGSDQVWNPSYGKIFLDFVPKEKKISYAASIGVSVIPDDKLNLFRRGIADFNYISVREENAVKLVKELTGRKATLLIDPVLLLTRNEWLAVSQKPTWLKEKYSGGYILTYYLSKVPSPDVKTLAAELDLPVINLLDTENYNHYTTGPAEFIWLFAHASLVFTNSFHGTAFSTLFKRPFIVNKKDVRISSFLKDFDLKDRFAPADPLKIDFARRDEVLPIERARAFEFLSEAFGVNPLEKILGGDA